MLRKLIYLLVLAPILFLTSSGTAFALSEYTTAFSTNYQAAYQAQHPGQSLTISVCNLCHVAAGPPNLNSYGDAYFNSTFNFAAIEALDSDGDGFSNLTEIMAYPETYPGDALSFPATAADTTAPTVTAFTIPTTASTLAVAITTLSATDAVGVTGYMVTESATAPLTGDTGWSASAPTAFTFSSAGAKTLYAWAKDAAGNVSAATVSTSAAIQVIAGTCATLDAILNVNIPCIDVGGQFYEVGLNRYENPTDFFGYYWSLGTAVPTTDNGSCASFDNSTWLVTLPCVDVNGTNYAVNLNYYVNAAAPQQFFWTLGAAQPTP